jgi:hypothetical protein
MPRPKVIIIVEGIVLRKLKDFEHGPDLDFSATVVFHQWSSGAGAACDFTRQKHLDACCECARAQTKP